MNKRSEFQFKVAIVITDQIISKMLNNFLKDLGYETVIMDPKKMVELSTNEFEKVKLVILPQSIAKAVVETIHEKTHEAMFIIFKDNGSTLSARDSLNSGVFGYIQNPIRLGELEVMLQRLKEYIKLMKNHKSISLNNDFELNQ